MSKYIRTYINSYQYSEFTSFFRVTLCTWQHPFESPLLQFLPGRIAAGSGLDLGPKRALRHPGGGEPPGPVRHSRGRLQFQRAVQMRRFHLRPPPPRIRTCRQRSISVTTPNGRPAPEDPSSWRCITNRTCVTMADYGSTSR